MSTFVLCLDDGGYQASLEVRKVYRSIRDASALEAGFVRIVDESGEDYLFPATLFVEVDVPSEVEELFPQAV